MTNSLIPVLDFLTKAIPDTPQRAFLINYIAYIVQNKSTRMIYSPVLQGPSGCGKSFLIREIIEPMFKTSEVSYLDAEILTSTFSDFASGKRLLILEDNTKHSCVTYDIFSYAKAILTSDVIHVNRKGRPSSAEKNITNVICITNEPLDTKYADRRFRVITMVKTDIDISKLSLEIKDHRDDILNYFMSRSV